MNKLCGLLLLLLLIISCSTRIATQKPNEDSNKVKISAVELHKEFLVDKNAALERYKNKKIEIKGKILHGSTTGIGSFVYLGEAEDPLRPFGESDHAISCRLDPPKDLSQATGIEVVLTCSKLIREDFSSGFAVKLEGCSITGGGRYVGYGAQTPR